MKVVVDEEGNIVDYLAQRNEKIIEELDSKMRILLDEKGGDRSGKKRLGFRMMMQINGALNRYPRMSAQDFCELDADDIDYYWNAYYDLMCYYNLYFEIVPNRQSFLKYIGLNARQYQQLQDSDDNDIKAQMIFIEDSLKQDGFSAGENGNVDSKALVTRLTARNDGHSMVSAGEEMLTQAVEKKNETELWRDLSRLTGNDYGKNFLK